MRSHRLSDSFCWRPTDDGGAVLRAVWERDPVARLSPFPDGRWQTTVYAHLSPTRQRTAVAGTEQTGRRWLERWAAAFEGWTGTARYQPEPSGPYPWLEPPSGADPPLGPRPRRKRSR